MLIGEKSRFAVEWEILEVHNNWVFGYIYLYINGAVIGNTNDKSVDLRGCLLWMEDLLDSPRNRFEPGLFDMDRELVFLRLASSVLVNEDRNNFATPIYPDIFSRFHISQIGMSSLEDVILLLVKNEQGRERCVWSLAEDGVLDAYLDAGEVEEVVLRAARELRDEISQLRPP